MNLNIVCCLFVLDKENSNNIRKNDLMKLKLLVNSKNELPNVKFDNKTDIKALIRDHIFGLIGSNMFHLEQVYLLGDEKFFEDKNIDVIYLGVTNICNIKDLNKKYKLIDFAIKNDNLIEFDNEVFVYNTIQKKINNNVEFFFEIKTDNLFFEKKLVEILTAYKQLRMKIDNSDIIFKFMGDKFTLEEVRIVYEMIKNVTVDKSNFRKKIIKYCGKTNDIVEKKGYRPTQLYCFEPLNNDSWL